jgi:hypothetical protein
MSQDSQTLQKLTVPARLPEPQMTAKEQESSRYAKFVALAVEAKHQDHAARQQAEQARKQRHEKSFHRKKRAREGSNRSNHTRSELAPEVWFPTALNSSPVPPMPALPGRTPSQHSPRASAGIGRGRIPIKLPTMPSPVLAKDLHRSSSSTSDMSGSSAFSVSSAGSSPLLKEKGFYSNPVAATGSLGILADQSHLVIHHYIEHPRDAARRRRNRRLIWFGVGAFGFLVLLVLFIVIGVTAIKNH